MAGQKRPIRTLFRQMNPANPMQASTSWQDFHTGVNDVGQVPHPQNFDIPSSYPNTGLAYHAPEPAGSGIYSPPETTIDSQLSGQNTSTWFFKDSNVWPATGATWSNTLSSVPNEPPVFSSWSSIPRLQNDTNIYQDPSQAHNAPTAWDPTLDAGHSPCRIQDMLIGMPNCHYHQEDCHRHPMMQDFDVSDVSSLSSSFPYDPSVISTPVVDHNPPSHVPWSRPQTYGEGILWSSPWIQSLEVSAPSTIKLVSERSDTIPCSSGPGQIVHASTPSITINGHQIVWDSLNGREVKLSQTPQHRTPRQRKETNEIRKIGACRRCRSGKRKCRPSHKDRLSLDSPGSSSSWSDISDGSSSFELLECPTPSPTGND